MPTFSSEDFGRRAVERRAVKAVIWGMPAVNFDRMYQAMVHDANAGEGSNKIVYWSRLFDWKNQTLTPNPNAIYLMPFINTKDVGPVVLDIPPADEGSITVDIYFGPKAPAGKESNWVPTSPNGKFEVLFRVYGPEKPFFDKIWKLPDIEKTN